MPDRCPSGSWPINFVRSVESNFYMHHLPFVHGSPTPGVGSRLDPYHVEVAGSHIRTWGELRRQDTISGIPFRVEFKMPGMSLIQLSPRIVFVVADCPIDSHPTWRFAYSYFDYLPVAGLHQLLSWLFIQIDWTLFQFPQDLRVMETQQPKLPDRHKDRLVRADGGTAAYLKPSEAPVGRGHGEGPWDGRHRRVAAAGVLLGEAQPVVMP